MKKQRFKPDTVTGALSENDTKRYFSTIGFAVFAFVLISYGATFVVSLLLTKFAPALLENDIFSYGASVVCQYGIALPVSLVILKDLPRDVGASEKIGFGQWLGALCIVFTFMTVGNTIGQSLTGILGSLLGRSLINPVASSALGTSPWINLVFMAILAPIIEELVFRKIFCDRLLPLGEGYAIFISAFIFGAVHGNLYQFFYAFLIGLVFSGIYVRTGRIRYSIIYHMIINALGGVIMPWVYEKLSPILTEEMLQKATELLQSDDMAAIEEFSAYLAPYTVPMVVYVCYVVIFNILSIAGIFVLFKYMRKVKLRAGLLPPAKEGRVANIFCNAGVAAAITAFVGIFILSLL